jgi:hypothetical protein
LGAVTATIVPASSSVTLSPSGRTMDTWRPSAGGQHRP